MLSYKEILEDPLIIKGYEKIDSINQHAFNHGMQHIKNVVEIIEKLSKVFKIDDIEKNNLLIAGVLHDIGQVDGRDEHGFKSKEFSKKYLNGKIEDEYLEIILKSIEFHSKINELYKLPLFCYIICLADKSDFTKKRLEKNYKEKFGYIVCENIVDINFEYTTEVFSLKVITESITNAKELLMEKNSFSKVIGVMIAISKKLNVIPEIYIDDEKIDII